MPYAELAKRVQGAEVKLQPGSLWYHWRDPDQHYQVVRVGIDEATEQLVVVYEMLFESKTIVWIRPLRGPEGWLTPIKHDGVEIPRFQRVS